MADTPVVSNLRRYRAKLSLSQSDVAERAGLSRQAIIAIEAGRQVPSTLVALRLAKVLQCSVEDLFRLRERSTLSACLASRGAVAKTARLALGRVDGVWVAHPIDSSERPGDGVLLGPVQADGSTALIEPLAEAEVLDQNVLVAGCDPLLGVLTGRFTRSHRDAWATWIPANSTRALELLSEGLVHVAGLHLVNSDTPEGHTEIVRRQFPGQAMTIVNLTRWRQGLVVALGNPLAIHGVADVARSGVRFARREPGAGAQKLVERLLAAKRIAKRRIADGPVVSGHAEVARLVRLGLADVGVAIEAAALEQGLDFIPLSEERFDLVVPRSRVDALPVARLLDLIDRPAFRSDASNIAGYDLSSAGHASTVTA